MSAATKAEALASFSLSPTATFADVWVRYFYHGGTAKRDGVLEHLGRRFNAKELAGAEVLEFLATHVDLERHEARVYSNALEGWAPMQADTIFSLSAEAGEVHRVDVQLFARTQSSEAQDDGPELEGKGVRAGRAAEPEGYFLCGAVGIKTRENLGTLFRSAYQLGAAGLFVIGDRLDQPSGRRGNGPPPSPPQPASDDGVDSDSDSDSEGGGDSNSEGGGDDEGVGEAPVCQREVKSILCQPTDTIRAWKRMPVTYYDGWNSFAAATPFGALLVAVEMGGEPLEHFEHPERAVYLLGSEDNGLPDSVVRACHRHVALPAVRAESYNVAAAGSILMYDRHAKELRRERKRTQL